MFAQRLAQEGFIVYNFDISGHGQTEGEHFRFGHNSEIILNAVAYVRKRGNVKKVTAIGHSIGAASTAFALLNYNSEMENSLYKLYEHAITLMTEEKYEDAEKTIDAIELLILDSLKKFRFSGSRIDSAIMVSPPKAIQDTVPVPLMRMIALFGKKAASKILKKTVNINTPVKDFCSYMMNVKAPMSFINVIDYFSSHGKQQQFFKRYMDVLVGNVPKLLVYGTLDLTLRTFMEKNKVDIENYYGKLQNVKIVPLTGMSHFLNPKWQVDSYESLTSDIAGKVIIDFLDSHYPQLERTGGYANIVNR